MTAGAEVIVQKTVLKSGPIFLDQLLCTESDNSLLECRTLIAAPGLTKCDHPEDVWIRCKGELVSQYSCSECSSDTITSYI